MTETPARSNSSISATIFNTLEQLAEKGEPERRYPIGSEDLSFHPNCPLTGSANVTPVARVRNAEGLVFFETSVCLDNLFVFRSVTPNYRWFQARWAEIATGAPEVFNPDIEALRRQRYGNTLDLVRKHRTAGRFIDIGAAFGAGCEVFREAGFSVEALEPEDDRAQYIRDRLGVTAHNVVIHDFAPDRSYDVINFSHVLEHVEDPLDMLRRVREWITPDGVLYLEVPLVWNIVDFRDALFLAHQSNFCEGNLSWALQQTGFGVLDKVYPTLNSGDADLGLVLTPAEPGTPLDGLSDDTEGRSAADIHELYRRNLPFPAAGETDAVLTYEVPYIEHFFYVVRQDKGDFVDRQAEAGVIAFEGALAV